MKLTLAIVFVLFSACASFGQEPTNNAAADASTSDRDKAIELYTNEDYKAAVPLFDKILTANENDWNSWFYFAMSLVKTSDSKNAAKAFKNALAVYPFKSFDGKDSPDKATDFKITSYPHAPYTDLARSNGFTGVVYLAVEFRADKKIGTIVPLKTLPGGLTESSIDAAKTMKFNPLTSNGKPVTIIRIIQYYFSIY